MSWLQNIKNEWRSEKKWRDILQDIGVKGIVKNMNFIVYCSVLTLLYITIVHRSENMIRKLNEQSKALKEMGWAYKDEKNKLMYLTKESELQIKAKEIGLDINNTAPFKIEVKQ